MRKAMLLLTVFGLSGLLWAAENPFDGNWKVDLDKIQFPEKPQIIVLQDGMFQCPSCEPQISVKVDGTDQPVKGSKSIDTMAIKIVDDNTVETTIKKGGKVIEASKTTVSSDGKTAIASFTDYPEGGKEPVTGQETMVRVADGPAGSHSVSGSWRTHKLAVPEHALLMTYKAMDDGLAMTYPAMGQSYEAKFDGKQYPIKGDPSGTTVSLKKVSDRAIDETDMRDGKVVSINHMTVSDDGNTLTVNVENKVQNTTLTFTAKKQ